MTGSPSSLRQEVCASGGKKSEPHAACQLLPIRAINDVSEVDGFLQRYDRIGSVIDMRTERGDTDNGWRDCVGVVVQNNDSYCTQNRRILAGSFKTS